MYFDYDDDDYYYRYSSLSSRTYDCNENLFYNNKLCLIYDININNIIYKTYTRMLFVYFALYIYIYTISMKKKFYRR